MRKALLFKSLGEEIEMGVMQRKAYSRESDV
jgi:hypothetical protein